MGSNLNRVSGQFFETAGIPIVAGRAITSADTLNSLKVVVVSQTIARIDTFPIGDGAIGHLLRVDTDSIQPGRGRLWALPETPNPETHARPTQ